MSERLIKLVKNYEALGYSKPEALNKAEQQEEREEREQKRAQEREEREERAQKRAQEREEREQKFLLDLARTPNPNPGILEAYQKFKGDEF
jgi:hypothetical protein